MTRVAAILYTLRDFTKTPADLARTLQKVKAIGYDAVQISGVGPVDPREMKAFLDGEGLTACASHVSLERLQTELGAVVDEHLLWGCSHLAIASAPPAYRNAEGYRRFAHEASELGRKLQEANLTLSYHNHAFELEKFGGRTGLSIIYEESDPNTLFAEIDTYWIQYGGGDSAAWIRRLAGRQPLVHFKDMAVRENKPVMAEIGEGNLNWPAIIQACREAGVQWHIVEQDTCPGDPFDSIATSLRNMRRLGLS